MEQKLLKQLNKICINKATAKKNINNKVKQSEVYMKKLIPKYKKIYIKMKLF